MKLQIKDHPGRISIAEMRNYFESGVKNTKVLADNTTLEIIESDGQFLHYADDDTNTLWTGFALGMRAAEVISNKTSTQIRQGHLYDHNGQRALALASGQSPDPIPVLHIDYNAPWLLHCLANPDDLRALPMRYHQGQLPEDRS